MGAQCYRRAFIRPHPAEHRTPFGMPQRDFPPDIAPVTSGTLAKHPMFPSDVHV
jgi:hypothetical protein